MNIDRVHRQHTYPSINALSAKLSSYGKVGHEQCMDGSNNSSKFRALPKKKTFPTELKIFLQFIPGNDKCPDCEVRGGSVPLEFKGRLPNNESTCLPWANVEYGCLICEECAERHIQLNKKTSSILSLESSNWNLPQIISLLEGGNAKFLEAVKKVDNKSWRFSSRTLVDGDDTEGYDNFEYRYKKDAKVQNYKTSHSFCVKQVCLKYGGDTLQDSNTCIISEQDFNDGTSLATLLVHKSKTGDLSSDLTSTLLNQHQEEPNEIAPKPKRRPSFLSTLSLKKTPKFTKPTESRPSGPVESHQRAAVDFLRRMTSTNNFPTKSSKRDSSRITSRNVSSNHIRSSDSIESQRAAAEFFKRMTSNSNHTHNGNSRNISADPNPSIRNRIVKPNGYYMDSQWSHVTGNSFEKRQVRSSQYYDNMMDTKDDGSANTERTYNHRDPLPNMNRKIKPPQLHVKNIQSQRFQPKTYGVPPIQPKGYRRSAPLESKKLSKYNWDYSDASSQSQLISKARKGAEMRQLTRRHYFQAA